MKLIRARDALDVPRAIQKPLPYSVKMRPGVGDAIVLTGHDRCGDPLIIWQISNTRFQFWMIQKLEDVCREADTIPAVAIAP